MTRDEIKSRIPILQAWLEQKAIQFSWNGGSFTDFKDRNEVHPDIFNRETEWRLSPEPPKPREWWLLKYRNGPWTHVLDKQQFAMQIGKPDTQIVHVREVIDEKGDPEELEAPEGGS